MGEYRFRGDKLGTQFWSGTSNHCLLPGCTSAVIGMTLPVAVSVVDEAGVPVVGVPVYVFDGSSYTNYSKTTLQDGRAAFVLPVGNYRFRADKDGMQYFSLPTNHCAVLAEGVGCREASIVLPADFTLATQIID